MKCIYCKQRHSNKGLTDDVIDTCFMCEQIIKILSLSVKAINAHVPINTGKNNRTLIIKEFEIKYGK